MSRTAIISSSSHRNAAASPLVIARLQRQIHRLVCSSPWFDSCWAAVAAGRINVTKRIDAGLDRSLLYPPGGVPRCGRHRTLMKRCKSCGARWYPPQYVRGCGICEDCAAAIDVPLTNERTHVSSTASATAEARAMLEYYQVRLVEPRLAAEDEASLRREIAAYHRRNPRGEGSFGTCENTKKHHSDTTNAEIRGYPRHSDEGRDK